MGTGKLFLGLFVLASLFFATSPASADLGDGYVAIELDKKVYTWTDKIYVTVVAPYHNFNSNLIDEIGNADQYPVKVATRNFTLENYRLVETSIDSGIFTGEIYLTGFAHNADGNHNTGVDGNDVAYVTPHGMGPSDGVLPAGSDDVLTISFESAPDDTVIVSASIRWNEGKVNWLETSYPASGTGVVRVTDPDMNWNPETIDNFSIDVWSDSDAGGINLVMTETNNSSGIFEGTVFFSHDDESSGHRLRIAEGDTVYAEYEDNTLPNPSTIEDELDIIDTALIDLSSNIAIPAEGMDELLSPIKQMRNGVLPSNIVCDEALEKIYRPSGHAAVCVTPETREKLIERGWPVQTLPDSNKTESEIMDRKYQMIVEKNMISFGEFLRVDIKIDSPVIVPHEIKVVGPDGRIYERIISESDDEHGWSFQARKNWPTGTYEIQLWHSGEKAIFSTFILQN